MSFFQSLKSRLWLLPFFLDAVAHFIDFLNEWVGRLVSWLVLLMVLIIVYDVSARYLFSQGSVMLQELQWHLFALIFLLGAAYTFKHDVHVRVDIIYKSALFSEKGRALINLIGGLVILLPFCWLVINSSIPFVMNAYQFNEGSPDPGGLPYRFILKGAIIVGFSLLALQALSSILHSLLILINFHQPKKEHYHA